MSADRAALIRLLKARLRRRAELDLDIRRLLAQLAETLEDDELAAIVNGTERHDQEVDTHERERIGSTS